MEFGLLAPCVVMGAVLVVMLIDANDEKFSSLFEVKHPVLRKLGKIAAVLIFYSVVAIIGCTMID